MKILNIIDSSILRALLSKFYIAAGVDYVFIAPEESLVADMLEDFAPDALLLQDSYCSIALSDLWAFVRKKTQERGRTMRFLLLESGPDPDGQAREIPVSPDVFRVNRENLRSVLDRLKAELLAAGKASASRAVVPAKAILVVEPSKTIRSVIKVALGSNRYRLTFARSAEEALPLFGGQHFDLVLTGVSLQGKSGFDLCREIKETHPDRYLPVIVLAAGDDPLDVDTAFNCGADDYLLKSSPPEMLAEKVADHLAAMDRKRNNKILVVDDSKVIRGVLRHGFIKSGLNVLTAENGVKALEIVLAEKPEVVITDIEMPEMDGYELCRQIRKRPELDNIFLLMMSTRDRPCDIKRGEKLGVSRYFVKPFDVEKLQLVVEQLLAEGYRQYQKEYGYLLASMKALIVALEARDKYTKGHTARVSAMALRLGRFLGLSETQLWDLEIAANLHDIGKIGVRDAVLLKAGKLTDEEYAMIQEHAIIGAEILRPITSLRNIIPLILLHHERWDGSGYPTMVKGEDIPLGARIIAVVDAYDAMTSDRPYRPGMAPEKAMSIIELELGRQFCATCGEAFLRMLLSEKKAPPARGGRCRTDAT